MNARLPERAKVVVIGGGVIGASVLYHLAKGGVTDAVLLERDRIASGTTWHAAGIVGQLRDSKAMTALASKGIDLFRSLEAETGQATGYRQTGSIYVALTPQRLESFKRTVSHAQCLDPAVRMLSAAEIKERWPLVRADDVLGGQFVPSNGQVNPLDLTTALIKGARLHGATAFEHTAVEDILIAKGRVTGVRTARGDIACDRVLLVGGMWTHQIAKKIGVTVPLHAAEHFYIVTEPIAGLSRNTPQLVVIDERAYYKEDAGKLLIGGFEAKSKAWPHAGEPIPTEFSFQDLPPDVEHMDQVLTPAFERVPALQNVGVKLFFCGPESFTPDGRPHMGPAAEVAGLYIAAGLNSNGISSSATTGMIMASWITSGLPPVSMGGVQVRRAATFQANTRYLRDRVVESVGIPMTLHWPGEFASTARGVRHFPLHDKLLAAGAVFGERIGWEIPLYYDRPGARLPSEPSLDYQAWFPQVERECLAARDAAVLVDLSCYAKLLVKGSDALWALNQVSANEIDVAVGQSVYTHWLNERGGTEADLTITRLALEEFLIVTGHTSQTRDRAWFCDHVDAAWNVQCVDVTSNFATLSLHGPRSREILQSLTEADVSNSALPFGAARFIDIGYARAWVVRRSFFGELGFELYPTADLARHVFEELMREGAPRGLVPAGFFAMNHCRVEKGFVAFGYDVAEEDTPLECGHRFTVAFDKPAGFVGWEALSKQRDQGVLENRLVNIRLQHASLEKGPYLFHNEPIWKNNVVVGYVTSGAWGFRLGGSFGLASVNKAGGVTSQWLSEGGFEVEVAAERHRVDVQFAPFYDAKGDRLRS